jgi:hypothetical protein
MQTPTNQQIYELITKQFSIDSHTHSGKDFDMIVETPNCQNYSLDMLLVATQWTIEYNKRPNRRWFAKNVLIKPNQVSIYMAYHYEPPMPPFPFPIKNLDRD